MKLVFVLLILSMLSACQHLLTTTRVATEAVVVDAIIDSGAPLDVISSIDLTDVELTALISATDRYKLFKQRWKNSIDQPIFPSYMLAAFAADFNNLVWNYKKVEKIAEDNWNKYDTYQQNLLLQWQAKSRSLSESTYQLIEMGAQNQALTNALDFGLLLLKLK